MRYQTGGQRPLQQSRPTPMPRQMLQAQRRRGKGEGAQRQKPTPPQKSKKKTRRSDPMRRTSPLRSPLMAFLLASSAGCYVPRPPSRPFLPEVFRSVARDSAQLQCFPCPFRMMAYSAGRVTSGFQSASGRSYAINGLFMSLPWQ